MTGPLTPDELADLLDERLVGSDRAMELNYPGDPETRQPVHTAYLPADHYTAGLTRDWGQMALALLDEHLPTPDRVAEIFGMSTGLAAEILPLVRAKLTHEPIEDLRIDFEDGFGDRGGAVEDAAVDASVIAFAQSVADGTVPPFSGIRFKSFEKPTRRRGLRTLERFVGGVEAHGGLPDGFVVTLPKVTAVEQVEAMVIVCNHLEAAYGLPDRRVQFEIQVETPQSILLPDGTAAVARMIAVADGRCTGLHYGTYDYSASCGIAAEYQSLEHPVADHAKAVMQVAAAGTGVRLSDGSTNVLPVGTDDEILAAWVLHARLVDRSLQRGFYQGWDLHPGQLPTRYLATFAFYRKGFQGAAQRLSAYGVRDTSGFLDEPATVRSLAWFVTRAVQCGAVTPAEVLDHAGLDIPALEALAHNRTG